MQDEKRSIRAIVEGVWVMRILLMAEEQGFEPWVGFPPQRFSRPSRSTAPELLRSRVSFSFLAVHVSPILRNNQWLVAQSGK